MYLYQVWCENGCGNNIFQSEIGSGLGEPGGTPPPKISGITFPDKQGVVGVVFGEFFVRAT